MDELDEVLKEINSHSIYGLHKMIPDHKYELINRAILRGYVTKIDRGTCQISPEGEKIVRSGIGWEAWELKNSNVPNIHIGHNITSSDFNQSDLSINRRNFSSNPPCKQTAQTKHCQFYI